MKKIEKIKSIIEKCGNVVPSKINQNGLLIFNSNERKESIDCFWKTDVLVNIYHDDIIVGYEKIRYEELNKDILDDCVLYLENYEKTIFGDMNNLGT
jgi:hypothetical protein